MPILCLIRHGESLWNKENRFTGWVDVPLTDTGREQAKRAGEILKSLNIKLILHIQVYYRGQLNIRNYYKNIRI
jgi:phosphoglycerate mutase (EC 5.4.2.1)